MVLQFNTGFGMQDIIVYVFVAKGLHLPGNTARERTNQRKE